MIIARMLLMATVACVAGFVWWMFNIVVGNLTVVDHYIEPGTLAWYAGAAFSIMLSVGLLALQVLKKYEKEYAEENLPIPRNTLILFGILTTLVDIPMPSYGIWLSQGWPADTLHGVLAFVIGGVIGSIISQWVMVECLLDIFACLGHYWNGAHKPRRTVVKQVEAKLSAGPPPQRRVFTPPPRPPDRDIDFSPVEE